MASFDDVELAARVSDELAKMSYEDKIAFLADRGIAAENEGDIDQMVFENLYREFQVV